MSDKPSYKDTMNLPKTAFKMKAGLPQNEPKRLQKWEDMDLYHKVLEKNEGAEPFILHDGPPYANGPIHIGHAFNKILKDIIVKFNSQMGHFSPYVPGWDCHGLPIENKVENELGPEKMAKIDTPTFRRICRQYAEKQLEIQRKGFKRLGVGGEWDDPYLTFTPEYEAGNVEVFKRMYLGGAIYQGRKPIHWCTHCHTALAEAEIEYADEVSPSIYVKFTFVEIPTAFKEAADKVGLSTAQASVLIWTTTPWTLPANTAVSLAPEANYVAAIVDGELLVMAQELVAKVAEVAGWDDVDFLRDGADRVVVKGTDLAGALYRHPIHEDMTGQVIYGDHVTLDTGTGAVHTAPGHGQDDYLVARRFDVAMIMPVNDDGIFTEEGGPWAGKDAVASNKEIIDWLDKRGALVAHVDISHSYPHCWRCHEPVIFRATTQWFVSMDNTGLRKAALEAIEDDVRWVPQWASNRIGSMIADRPDWCISRQRSWGVPIPVFHCGSCGETIATEQTFDAVIELFKTKGADAWYTTEPSEYLPEGTCCAACGSHDIRPETDILDVWWESGVSHTSVCEARPYLRRPADLYLEGSDQHRGWFQSSLLTSMAAYGTAPYRAVMSCGFTVDGEGRKMSKSLGNVVDPADVIAASGADVLRLWVGSIDYSQDVSLDDEIIARTSEAYRRIRNTFRYLLGNLYDFTDESFVEADEMLEVDRWALARLIELTEEVTAYYKAYRFHMAYRTWYDFIVSISSVYMDAIKDRLYSDAPASIGRRSAQSVLANMLEAMVRQLAPILTFTTDEVWEDYPEGMQSQGRPESIQLAGWPSQSDFVPQIPADERAGLIDAYETVMLARDAVTKAIEQARNDEVIVKSQEAAVRIVAPEATLALLADRNVAELAELFIVASVELVCDERCEHFEVQVETAAGEKCPRCWNYRDLGIDGLCARCHEVVQDHDA